MMSDVEVKLPGGLECTVPHELDQWPSNPKMQNDDMIHRRAIMPADEEVRVVKLSSKNAKVELFLSVTVVAGQEEGTERQCDRHKRRF